MHSQPDDLTTVYEQFLTTDSHGYYTWKQIATTLPASQLVEENILFNTILSAMPSDMAEEFQNDDTGVLLIQTLLSQFSRNSSPSWFARLSAPARTYFMTRWLGVLRDSFDIQGTSWETLKALQVTTISDNVPDHRYCSSQLPVWALMSASCRILLTCRCRQSQEWTYMGILLSAVPAQIAILNVPGTLYDRRARIASAVYDQFTSGSAPPWFTAMPKDAQSYVVQDFLPNNLEDPMTLDILALASPGSTATPAPGPTATPSAEPAHGVTSKDKAVVTGTVVPVISIGLAIAFIIWFIRRRRTKQRSRPASATHPYDIERATQRWSETTFTTTAQPLSYHTQVSPSSPGPLTVSPVSDRTASVRRTLSESDLRGGEKNLVEMGLSKSQDEPLELEAPVVPKLERRRSMSTDLRSA